MIQSILSPFQSAPSEALVARIWLWLLICNIISSIVNRFKSKNLEKKILTLQKQITEVRNTNTMENIQNKYIGLSSEEVSKLYKELKDSDKELNDKFLSKKDYQNFSTGILDFINNHDERLNLLFKYTTNVEKEVEASFGCIDSIKKMVDLLFEHTKSQDEYMKKIPVIEIPEDWIENIENVEK